MKIKKKHYKRLMFLFITSLLLFIAVTSLYIEEKNAAIEEQLIEEQGFICSKNILGVYSNCYDPTKITYYTNITGGFQNVTK